jgi:hypothetical protein
MPKGAMQLFEGIFVLILAIVIWRLTHSFIGWAMLFAPGAALVSLGLVRVIGDWP